MRVDHSENRLRTVLSLKFKLNHQKANGESLKTFISESQTNYSYRSGLAPSFFSVVVNMKITKRLDGGDNCVVSGEDFNSIIAVHQDFEKW